MKLAMTIVALAACCGTVVGCGGRPPVADSAAAVIVAEPPGDRPTGDTFPAVYLGERDGRLEFVQDHGFPGVGLPSAAVSVPLSKPMTVRRFGVETTHRSLVPGDRVELTMRDSRRVLIDVPDGVAQIGSAGQAFDR